MKNIIEYFYKIDINQIKYKNNKYYIFSNNNYYIFEKCKSKVDMLALKETQKYENFHKIIYNFRGELITNFENNNYILFQITTKKENKLVDFNDIKSIFSLRVFSNVSPYKWDILWSKKIDNFENYITKKNKMFKFREYYDYFIGLGENAIQYYQFAKNYTLEYGITYSRIKKNFELYDLYDPLNVTISSPVKGIAEYIKEAFFNDSPIDIINIESLNLNYQESVLLISRLLFPTYFFYIFHNGKEENKEYIEKIINYSLLYEKYLKKIFKTIKKKYSYIPSITWLQTNQP